MKILSLFTQTLPSPEEKYLLNLDLSPLDYQAIKKQVAHEVNIAIGQRDGGNTNIGLGRVLYPEEQDARRKEMLAIPLEFYME